MYEDRPVFKSGMTRFEELMARYRDLGQWRIVRKGSREYDDVLVARLAGTRGTVEVWGGDLHRREVWAIGRDRSETLVAVGCHGDDLRAAIEDACSIAGVQVPMPV